MPETTLKQKVVKFDNRITFVVGYRNLYNFAVMFVASMSLYFGDVLGTPYFYMLALILFVLAGKWFLMQVRDNIDAMEVKDTLATVG